MEGFANTPFTFQPDTSLRGKKRTTSARFNSPARIDKDAWFYCLKCKQQGHLMRDCEKVRQELQQALAKQLADQLSGAPSQEDAVMNTEDEASENRPEKDDENIVEPVKRVKIQDAAIQKIPDGNISGNAVDITKPPGVSNSFMRDTLAEGHEPVEVISMGINRISL